MTYYDLPRMGDADDGSGLETAAPRKSDVEMEGSPKRRTRNTRNARVNEAISKIRDTIVTDLSDPIIEDAVGGKYSAFSRMDQVFRAMEINFRHVLSYLQDQRMCSIHAARNHEFVPTIPNPGKDDPETERGSRGDKTDGESSLEDEEESDGKKKPATTRTRSPANDPVKDSLNLSRSIVKTRARRVKVFPGHVEVYSAPIPVRTVSLSWSLPGSDRDYEAVKGVAERHFRAIWPTFAMPTRFILNNTEYATSPNRVTSDFTLPTPARGSLAGDPWVSLSPQSPLVNPHDPNADPLWPEDSLQYVLPEQYTPDFTMTDDRGKQIDVKSVFNDNVDAIFTIVEAVASTGSRSFQGVVEADASLVQGSIQLAIQVEFVTKYPLDFAYWATGARNADEFLPKKFAEYHNRHAARGVSKLGKKKNAPPIQRVGSYLRIRESVKEREAAMGFSPEPRIDKYGNCVIRNGGIINIPNNGVVDKLDEYYQHVRDSWDPVSGNLALEISTDWTDRPIYVDWMNNQYVHLNSQGDIRLQSLQGSMAVSPPVISEVIALQIGTTEDTPPPDIEMRGRTIWSFQGFLQQVDAALKGHAPYLDTTGQGTGSKPVGHVSYTASEIYSALLCQKQYYPKAGITFEDLISVSREDLFDTLGGNTESAFAKPNLIMTLREMIIDAERLWKRPVAFGYQGPNIKAQSEYTFWFDLFTRYADEMVEISHAAAQIRKSNTGVGVDKEQSLSAPNLPNLKTLMPHQNAACATVIQGVPEHAIFDIHPGGGKCLDGKTLIVASDGLKTNKERFDEISKKDGFTKFTQTVYTLDGPVPTSHMYRVRGKGFGVDCTAGYHFRGLPEHKFLAVTPGTYEIDFVRLDQLADTWLPVMVGADIFPDEEDIEFAETCDLGDLSAATAEVPYRIRTRGRETQRIYLSRVFDERLTVTDSEISLISRSEILVEQLRAMLNNFGVLAGTFFETRGDKRPVKWHGLHISPQSYMVLEGKFYRDLEEQVYDYETSPDSFSDMFDRMPGAALIQGIIGRLATFGVTYPEAEDFTQDAGDGAYVLDFLRFDEFIKSMPHDLFQKIFDEDFLAGLETLRGYSQQHWIYCYQSYEDVAETVYYDYSVPGPSNYVAAGPVSHNTITYIVEIASLLDRGLIKRALVVCPPTLIREVTKEINSVSQGMLNPCPINSEVVSRLGQKRHADLDAEGIRKYFRLMPKNTIFVTSYEFLGLTDKFTEGADSSRVISYGEVDIPIFPNVDFMMSLGLDYIVCDESHKVKNSTGLRNNSLAVLASQIQYRRLASGTVLDNRARDIVGQLGLLNPRIFGSISSFDRAVLKDLTPQDRDRVVARIPPFAARITAHRSAWAFLLPKIREAFWDVELTPRQTEYYNSLIKEAMVKLEKNKEDDGAKKKKTPAGIEDDDDDLSEDNLAVLKQALHRADIFLSAPDEDYQLVGSPSGKPVREKVYAKSLDENGLPPSGDDLVSPKLKIINGICLQHLLNIDESQEKIFTQRVPHDPDNKIIIFCYNKAVSQHVMRYLDPRLKAMAIHYTAGNVDAILEFQKNRSIKIIVADETSLNTGFNLQCFPGQTPVLVDSDRAVSMEDIYNDPTITHVLGYDLETKKISRRRILAKMRHDVKPDDKYVQVCVRDEITGKAGNVVCTADHRFFLYDGTEIYAGDLSKNDRLITFGGQFSVFSWQDGEYLTGEALRVAKIKKAALQQWANEDSREKIRSGIIKSHSSEDYRNTAKANSDAWWSSSAGKNQRRIQSETMRSRWLCSEYRRYMKKCMQDWYASPEFEETMRSLYDEEYRKTLSERSKEYWKEQDRISASGGVSQKDVISIAAKARWDDPIKRREMSAAISESLASPEVREAMAERMRMCWDKYYIEWAAKHVEINQREDVKKKIGEASRRNWEDPEYRHKVCASMRATHTQEHIKNKWKATGKKNWAARSDESKLAMHTKALQGQGVFPNKPEKAVIDMGVDNLEYTGDGKYWVTLNFRGTSIKKNPDFICTQSGWDRVSKVVEIIGAREYTQRNAEYDADLIRAYALAGIECLIIDADDVSKFSEDVEARLQSFVNNHNLRVTSVRPVAVEDPRVGKYKYDIEVEGTSNFFVVSDKQNSSIGGQLPILVHNCASRICRMQTLWTPGAMRQATARIMRPDPRQIYDREFVSHDWLKATANRALGGGSTIDVGKIALLVAKTLSNMRLEYSEDRDFRDLERTLPEHLVSRRMNLGVLLNTKPEDLGLYMDVYEKIQQWEQRKFDKVTQAYKEAVAAKLGIPVETMTKQQFLANVMVPFDGQGVLEGSQEAFTPFLQGAPIPDKWGLSLIPLQSVETTAEDDEDATEEDDDDSGEDNEDVLEYPIQFNSTLELKSAKDSERTYVITEFGPGWLFDNQTKKVGVTIPGLRRKISFSRKLIYIPRTKQGQEKLAKIVRDDTQFLLTRFPGSPPRAVAPLPVVPPRSTRTAFDAESHVLETTGKIVGENDLSPTDMHLIFNALENAPAKLWNIVLAFLAGNNVPLPVLLAARPLFDRKGIAWPVSLGGPGGFPAPKPKPKAPVFIPDLPDSSGSPSGGPGQDGQDAPGVPGAPGQPFGGVGDDEDGQEFSPEITDDILGQKDPITYLPTPTPLSVLDDDGEDENEDEEDEGSGEDSFNDDDFQQSTDDWLDDDTLFTQDDEDDWSDDDGPIIQEPEDTQGQSQGQTPALPSSPIRPPVSPAPMRPAQPIKPGPTTKAPPPAKPAAPPIQTPQPSAGPFNPEDHVNKVAGGIRKVTEKNLDALFDAAPQDKADLIALANFLTTKRADLLPHILAIRSERGLLSAPPPRSSRPSRPAQTVIPPGLQPGTVLFLGGASVNDMPIIFMDADDEEGPGLVTVNALANTVPGWRSVPKFVTVPVSTYTAYSKMVTMLSQKYDIEEEHRVAMLEIGKRFRTGRDALKNTGTVDFAKIRDFMMLSHVPLEKAKRGQRQEIRPWIMVWEDEVLICFDWATHQKVLGASIVQDLKTMALSIGSGISPPEVMGPLGVYFCKSKADAQKMVSALKNLKLVIDNEPQLAEEINAFRSSKRK